MIKRFYKWFRVPVEAGNTRVEVTKDYFCDGDEYINETEGWSKIIDHYIDIEVNNEQDCRETHYSN